MFLACGVIVVTLLLATFIVPLLAPKKAPPTRTALRRDGREPGDTALRHRGALLASDRRERAATQLVLRSYNQRIARIKSTNDIEDEPNTALRLQALRWEQDFVEKLIESEDVHPVAGYRHLNRLNHIENMLLHHHGRWSLQSFVLRLRALVRAGWHLLAPGLPGKGTTERTQAARDLQIRCADRVSEQLSALLASPQDDFPTEDVSALLLEYQRVPAIFERRTPPSRRSPPRPTRPWRSSGSVCAWSWSRYRRATRKATCAARRTSASARTSSSCRSTSRTTCRRRRRACRGTGIMSHSPMPFGR